MQKTCLNNWCKQSFEVTDDDLAFYDKVSPEFGGKKYAIPPPTRCPDCRLQRRMAHANESHLYRRKSASGTDILSIFSPDKPYQVLEPKEWWGDGWDPMVHGQEPDATKTVLEQFRTLTEKVPLFSLFCDSNENSDYVNYAGWDKNCYLCYCVDYSQDCQYCHSVYYAKNCTDCLGNLSCELCYECVSCKNCYQTVFSQDCANCSDGAFLLDCLHCTDCFGCFGLRHKKYCFFNEQCTKEEYKKRLKTIDLGSQETVSAMRLKLKELTTQYPRRACIGEHNENATGNYISQCKNVVSCFDCSDLEDSKFCHSMRGAKDCYDISHWGHPGELCYECMGVGEGFLQSVTCSCCWNSCANLAWCFLCISCQDCLLCVGLRKKSYCILNRQYTKDEYEKLAPKLIEKLMADGLWGEFFPTSVSPFGYNETMAQEYFPLTREQALERGFRWSNFETPPPVAAKLIAAQDLPDVIGEIPDDILHWAIECDVTKKPFKIIRQELDFYRRMQLPVPRLHPDERHKRRMALRNPRKLWNRVCDKCSKPIITSYSPERPEIVYCEECYLKEVY